MDSSLKREYLDALNHLDLYVCLNKAMFSWFASPDKSILIQHPVHPSWLYFKENNQDHRSVCVGIGTWNIDFLNILTNCIVYEKLKIIDPIIYGGVLGIFEHERSSIKNILQKYNIESSTWESSDFIKSLKKEK